MGGRTGRVVVGVLLLFATCLSPCLVGCGDHSERSPAQDVLEAVYSSVVRVTASVTGTLRAEQVGSGIVYTADGCILTNAHIVTLMGIAYSGQTVTVTLSTGEEMQAQILGIDEAHDLAAIKIDTDDLQPVEFEPRDEIMLGEWAIVIGTPLDLQNSVSLGIISGVGRTLDLGQGQPPLTNMIQIDAAVSPGSSGGGFFDQSGHFVGMPVGYLPPAETGAQNIAFAIPSDVVERVAEELTGR